MLSTPAYLQERGRDTLIRVNGVDVDPTAATRDTYGLMCRVYPTNDGPRGTPPDGWILAALHRKSSAGRAG